MGGEASARDDAGVINVLAHMRQLPKTRQQTLLRGTWMWVSPACQRICGSACTGWTLGGRMEFGRAAGRMEVRDGCNGGQVKGEGKGGRRRP